MQSPGISRGNSFSISLLHGSNCGVISNMQKPLQGTEHSNCAQIRAKQVHKSVLLHLLCIESNVALMVGWRWQRARVVFVFYFSTTTEEGSSQLLEPSIFMKSISLSLTSMRPTYAPIKCIPPINVLH